MLNSDSANNLAATALVTNAYLYTGEEKYRRWVLDYVEVWLERIRANGGIIPDNVGAHRQAGRAARRRVVGRHVRLEQQVRLPHDPPTPSPSPPSARCC